jgi:predicted DNA-binding protein (MmcQ/YjbR family)
MSAKANAAMEHLRAFGLKYPGAHTKSPWPGHADLAVNDKTFAHMAPPGEGLFLGVKLPFTGEEAREKPWATPTPYGLGKSGWTNFSPPDEEIDLPLFERWIDESYRAQAPKKLVKLIDAR